MVSVTRWLATVACSLTVGAGCASTGWDASIPPRTVRLVIAVDEAFRFHASWEDDLHRAVRSTSETFEAHAGVRFETLRVVPWQAPPLGDARALDHLLATIPATDADVVVGVSGGCDHTHAGSARLFSRVALATTGCAPFLQKRTPTLPQLLMHELAHVFGAFHPVAGTRSIMRGGAVDDWDGQMLRVIRLMRRFDFGRGVDGIDAATRAAYDRIYAEGHDPADTNGIAVALRNDGRTLFEAGKLDAARDRFVQAAAIEPHWFQPYHDLGVWHARRRQRDEAARFLRQAAERSASARPQVRLTIASRLEAVGDRDRALELYEDTVRSAPAVLDARIALAGALLDRNRPRDAEPHLREATRLTPSSAVAWEKLVTALMLSGRYGDAWTEVQRAGAAGVVIPTAMQERLRRESGAPSSTPAR
jgi:Flp pilus assembly protein TadD